MENNRLKIKIGEHEFEAEGPSEVVQAQFAIFKELMTQMPVSNQTERPPVAQITGEVTVVNPPVDNNALALDKIMKQDGRVVSLTVRGASLEVEILLVLLGQKLLRSNESVTGSEIMDGLKLTGRVIGRIDYQLDKMSNSGDVITIGIHRARRYRLSNQGSNKAKDAARAVIATVA